MLANYTAFLKPFLRSRILSPALRWLGKTNSEFFRRARSEIAAFAVVFSGMLRSPELVFAAKMRIVRWVRSSCAQERDNSSPRRMPVFSARTTAEQRSRERTRLQGGKPPRRVPECASRRNL